MTLPPQTQSGKLALEEATALYKSLRHRIDDFKKLRELSAKVKELESLREGVYVSAKRIKDAENKVSKLQKLTNFLNTDITKLNKRYQPLKKLIDSAKAITDPIKQGQFNKANPNLGAAVNVGLILGSLAVSFMTINAQGQIQEVELRKQGVLQRELDIFSRINAKFNARISSLEKATESLTKRIKEGIDRVYAETAAAIQNATKARESANNALYETRAGRAKLDAQVAESRKLANDALYEVRIGNLKLSLQTEESRKLANDALFEVRAGRAKLDAQVIETRKLANDALYETRAGRTKLDEQIQQLQSQFSKTTKDIRALVETSLQATLANINKGLAEAKAKADKANSQIDQLSPKVVEITKKVIEIPKLIENIVNPLSIKLDKNVVDLGTLRVTFENFTKQSTTEIAGIKQQQQTTQQQQAKIDSVVGAQGKSFEQSARDFQAQFDATQQKIKENERIVIGLPKEISSTSTQISKLKEESEKNKADIDKLKIGSGEQDKLNREALNKLDKMIPLLGTIPLIARDTANIIKPSIPTIPQIEQAAATGTCKTYQPGGCGNKALNDAANNINSNTNANANNILDGLNAAGNLEQLRLLNQIDSKIGAQVPGGLSGKLERFTKWLHLDRILNILIFGATIQNHLMLSNNIAQTLTGGLTNILNLIGLKDDKGDSFDLGTVINSTVENFIKSVVGSENYNTISEIYAKSIRTYQAAANVFNSFLGLTSIILQANEMIASYTGKIGNALKKGGVVLENAYGWMNPSPRFDRTSRLLSNLSEGASTIQMVTQVPLDVTTAATELTNASTEFVKAIKEDGKPENNATPIPEPETIKAKADAAKLVSQPIAFNIQDFFDGED